MMDKIELKSITFSCIWNCIIIVIIILAGIDDSAQANQPTKKIVLFVL